MTGYGKTMTVTRMIGMIPLLAAAIVPRRGEKSPLPLTEN